MDKKNKVVSIEEHIPRLKQERKKKANRRLIFYLSIFFFLISIIVYLQSPLSHIKTISVQGNVLLENEEIIGISGLSLHTSIWTMNKDRIVNSLQNNPIIDSAKVKRKLPWTVEIQVKEHEHVGYIKKNSHFYPLLANGNILEQMKLKTTQGDAPIMYQFTEKEYLQKMIDQLQKLPKNISGIISEIHWEPTKKNKNKIILYMNDGYMVSGTIRDFANKMEMYPSIVSQLEPGKKGIIHIGVGTYFEEFKDKN